MAHQSLTPQQYGVPTSVENGCQLTVAMQYAPSRCSLVPAEWRWDPNTSPRDNTAPKHYLDRGNSTCVGKSGGAMVPAVVRQSSAPEPLSPFRANGVDVAACWLHESSPRQIASRASETPRGPLPPETVLRAESPPRDHRSGDGDGVGGASVMAGSPQTARWPSRRELSGRRARGGSLQRLVRPAWGVGGGSLTRRVDEPSPTPRVPATGAATCMGRSPRDDRASSASGGQRSTPGRCNSMAALGSDSGRMSANRFGKIDDAATSMAQLQRDLEEARRDNSKLQDKLCKAKNLMVLVQKQADDARAERDRERLKAESLQKSSQHLMKQLRRETAKVHLLERQLSAASRGEHWRQGTVGDHMKSLESFPSGHPGASGNRALDMDDNQYGRAGLHALGSMAPLLDEGSGGAADPDNQGCCVNFGDEAAGGCAPQSCELTNVSEFVCGEQKVQNPTGNLPEARTSDVDGVGEDHRADDDDDEDDDIDDDDDDDDDADDSSELEQKSWEFVVQGQHDSSAKPQHDFAAKAISCYPDDAVERAAARGVACICSRGRRMDRGVPNQDDFVAARHTLVHGGHIALYGVFDGHGPAGHQCAAFARGALPESLFGQRTLLLKPEDTLREAFRQTQESLLDQPFDTANSGTTVALALVLSLPATPACEDSTGTGGSSAAHEHGGEAWLFVAHVGDSRAILASHRGGEPSAFTVTTLTRDHRPDDVEEAQRVRQHSGEIRKLRETSGAARVFARGQDKPALALTRSLGASAAASCGVISEPEVSAYRLRPGVDVLLLLGTDGLFEFCNNTSAAGQLLKDGLSMSALEELCQQSRERWTKSSFNETVDDITAIAAVLPAETLHSP